MNLFLNNRRERARPGRRYYEEYSDSDSDEGSLTSPGPQASHGPDMGKSRESERGARNLRMWTNRQLMWPNRKKMAIGFVIMLALVLGLEFSALTYHKKRVKQMKGQGVDMHSQIEGLTEQINGLTSEISDMSGQMDKIRTKCDAQLDMALNEAETGESQVHVKMVEQAKLTHQYQIMNNELNLKIQHLKKEALEYRQLLDSFVKDMDHEVESLTVGRKLLVLL